MNLVPLELFAPSALHLDDGGRVCAEAPPRMSGDIDGWMVATFHAETMADVHADVHHHAPGHPPRAARMTRAGIAALDKEQCASRARPPVSRPLRDIPPSEAEISREVRSRHNGLPLRGRRQGMLSLRERRALRKIGRNLRREDPDLASVLSTPLPGALGRRRPDFYAARRRRTTDLWTYSRVGRRQF